ncbi:MAG: asparagine synthetase A [Candidatus Diapherotrites archaeon]
MDRLIEKMKSEETQKILRVQSVLLKSISDFLHEKKLLQVMPVILSPETDPLSHSVFDASIDYYGQKLQLTKSMILHKFLYVSSPFISGVYCFSPNVRLEKKHCAGTGRHLIEFTQIDIEFKEKSKHEFMDFFEDLVIHVLSEAKSKCEKELDFFGRELVIPKKPFKVFESKELEKKYGKDFEEIISRKLKEPFWILDHKREFYDKEDKEKKDYYHNYDLVWPEGFGEALSGGEREFELTEIKRKLAERGSSTKHFKTYASLAEKGLIKPSAGGGMGIERALRFITGKKCISEVTFFPRLAGEKIVI